MRGDCIYNKVVAGDDLFVWDEAKRARNLRKHGVDFLLAERFDFDAAATLVDGLRAYGETRYRAFGFVEGRLYVVIFTRRADNIRIISVRKANDREVKDHAPR